MAAELQVLVSSYVSDEFYRHFGPIYSPTAASYLAPYSLSEFMIRPSYLLLYDKILADEEAWKLLETEEKQDLIRKRYSTFFGEDPTRLLRYFLDVLLDRHLVERIRLQASFSTEAIQLLNVLRKIDELDPRFRRAYWRIERCNLMLLSFYQLGFPFYDTWTMQEYYEMKLAKPSFAVAYSILRNQPDLLVDPSLASNLRKLDKKLGKWSDCASSRAADILQLPQIKPIKKREDVTTVLSLIDEEKNSNEQLVVLKARMIENLEQLRVGTEKSVEIISQDLKSIFAQARLRFERAEERRDWLTIGAVPLTLAAFVNPSLTWLAGIADIAAFISAIDARLHNRRYGWLYYLHNVGVI